ncbi:hypothetical protein AB9K34_00300 [Sedimentitalea sp. XS_ASV28]|uniref:hypothetical protein n=1 Tax=Sedimentitalea sp. XS_ASV28 TaxID=3241296 RepID=UPI0035112F19
MRRQAHRVKPITLRDLSDLFQLREIIEVVCVRLMVGNVDATTLHRLDELCSADYDPNRKESVADCLQRNTDFSSINCQGKWK